MSTSLPVFRPEVLDNSFIETVARCPRKAQYKYALRRQPVGDDYSLQFGWAYHKYRELLEKNYLSLEDKPGFLKDKSRQQDLLLTAFNPAIEKFRDPPLGHKKEFLTLDRFMNTVNESFQRWMIEKREGKIVVLYVETAFDLTFDGFVFRFGGRMDQIIEWHRKLWVRDFKTTSTMGKTFPLKFDPNHQMSGYTTSAHHLSGRPVEGVIIEAVYNTKLQGPTFHQFLSTRSPGSLTQWQDSIAEEMHSIDRYYTNNSWPMRTVACNDYGGCFYRGACQQEHWVSIDQWLLDNTAEKEWDFMNPDGEEGWDVT